MSDKYKSYSITLQMADGSRHKIPIAVPVGEKGDPGNDGTGIASIEKTNTIGNTDTYTVTLTDGSTTTFSVTNGRDGKNGKDGEPFLISKTFPSVAEMNAGADTDGVLVGQYVAIDTNVEDPDSAKIFIKTENGYQFVVDLSGKEGIQGPKGDTPVFGEDYFTPEHKAEIVEQVIAELPPSDVTDIQLNGATIVDENGVATIPIAPTSGGVGVVRLGKSANGNMHMGNCNGVIVLRYPEANANGLKGRKAQGSQYSGTVSSNNFDLAVKTAMTDGIGAEWTEVERAAARARMGAVSLEEVLAVIKPMLGTYFPTGEAGVYRHGSNFTELLYTWDEIWANGEKGEDWQSDYTMWDGAGYIMGTVGGDIILPDDPVIYEMFGAPYWGIDLHCGNVVIPAWCKDVDISVLDFKSDDSTYGRPNSTIDCNLETIYIKATTPPPLYMPKEYVPYLTKIVVLTGRANAYKSATGWCDYAEIIVEGIIE